MKVAELAQLTGARCDSTNSDVEIDGAAGIDDAKPGQVTFLSNPRYALRVNKTAASAIYVGEDVEVTRNDIALLRARDPYLAFTRALVVFHPSAPFESYWDPTAVIDSSTQVPKEIFIDAHVAIGKNVQLGRHVRLHANVTIY